MEHPIDCDTDLALTEPERIAVQGFGDIEAVVATELADRLGLPLIDHLDEAACRFDFVLTVTPMGLELSEVGVAHRYPLRIDFTAGAVAHRRLTVSRRQPIARALGLRRGLATVVDATAGLGRDAFVLACLGCKVIGIERHAILAAMIENARRRAATSETPGLRSAVERLQFIPGDACAVLPRLCDPSPPDVVYLDPMYPPRRKAAVAKKELRILRRLVGDDTDAAELFDVARSVGTKRVVVKRHRRAEPLAPRPSLHFEGKQVRYDVYLAANR